MEYLNIPTSIFSSPEFIGAEPAQRATWIALLGWCCDQENGGVVRGCRHWNDRRWMQTCGVTSEEVCLTSDLYRFEGDDLVVYGFPKELQDAVQARRLANRENGKKGGRPSAKKVPQETEEEPAENPKETEQKPTDNPSETQPEPTEKRKKERKKERKEYTPPYPLEGEAGECADYPLDVFIADVRTCREAWQVGELTRRERQAAAAAYRDLGAAYRNHAETVYRYYRSSQDKDRKGNRYFRYDDLAAFLNNLRNVISQAQRWADDQQ